MTITLTSGLLVLLRAVYRPAPESAAELAKIVQFVTVS